MRSALSSKNGSFSRKPGDVGGQHELRDDLLRDHVLPGHNLRPSGSVHPKKIAIVGSGLGCHLLLARLQHERSSSSISAQAFDFEISVFSLNGRDDYSSHTWCCFRSDLSTEMYSALFPLILKQWASYEINIGRTHRTLSSDYLSFTPQTLSPLRALVSNWKVGRTEVVAHNELKVWTGEKWSHLFFDEVIDTRGWDSKGVKGVAYQKFYGLEVEFSNPHDIFTPRLMDAQTEQLDGFQFYYWLPFSNHRLLLEDTRFAMDPHIDEEAIHKELMLKLGARGRFKVLRVEKGVLPLPLQKTVDRDSISSSEPEKGIFNPIKLGACSGSYNHLTGYTFPSIAQQIDGLITDIKSGGRPYVRYSQASSSLHKKNRFYELLNRMLYYSSKPHEEYKVMERFYTLPENLIERLYGSRLTRFDQLKILSLNPPVNRWKALKCVFENKTEEFYGL